jgi:hypothetical protein
VLKGNGNYRSYTNNLWKEVPLARDLYIINCRVFGLGMGFASFVAGDRAKDNFEAGLLPVHAS